VVFLHIWAALIGILFGLAALFLRKGSRLHRATGNVFFVSMLVMTSVAAFRAAFAVPVMTNVFIGVLTFYLVASAWLTVKRKAGTTGVAEIVLLLMVLAVGIAGSFFGWETAHSENGLKDGASPVGYYIIGSLALLHAGLDVRMLIRGGVAGAQRIARHLWRMCFALFIAVGSLFLGQQQVFPETLQGSPLLFVPVIVVIAATMFWLVRVLFAGAYRKFPKTVESDRSGVPAAGWQ
jgi:uncharacterized membrane protein